MNCQETKPSQQWVEHYITKTGRIMQKTLEGFWCENHHKPHPTKTIQVKMVGRVK